VSCSSGGLAQRDLRTKMAARFWRVTPRDSGRIVGHSSTTVYFRLARHPRTIRRKPGSREASLSLPHSPMSKTLEHDPSKCVPCLC